MRKKLAMTLAVSMLATSLLSACGSSASNGTTASGDAAQSSGASTEGTETPASSGDHEGYLMDYLSSDIMTADVQKTSNDYEIPMNIYDTLVKVEVEDDGSSEIAPMLAESWEVSDDGLTYTFHLREDAAFQNGNPVTAQDVKYTFTRMFTAEGTVNGSFLDQIAGTDELSAGSAEELTGVEVLDDHTVQITLKEPFGAFLSALAFTACAIYDDEATEAAGDDFGMVPEKTVGSGPFIFESWTPNAELVLKRNDNYWGGAAKIPGVVIRIIPDTETQTMMFENGELDLLDLQTNPEAVDRIIETYPDQIVSGPIMGVDYVFMNQNVEPLTDVRVRKAIQMSIDRETILDEIYSGRGKVENGLFANGMIGYNENLPVIPYDPEQAKALLAEAGYPDGFTIELGGDSSDSETRTMITEIIQAMLSEVGINLEIKKYDQSTWLETRRAGTMPMYVSSWTADFNDPDNFMYTFFGTEENTKLRSINYQDASVIAQVAAARTIVDTDERIAKYQELEEKIMQEDASLVPLWSRDHLFAVSKRTKGFKVSWNGFSDSSYYPVYFEE
ncbi:MAG: ABC transporter substrate-binding protein [Eubacteriales bacterium]|nr:ABC transporter substrate-binding protein [Eubacteriales bacterium]